MDYVLHGSSGAIVLQVENAHWWAARLPLLISQGCKVPKCLCDLVDRGIRRVGHGLAGKTDIQTPQTSLDSLGYVIFDNV